jgi:hypothetical protein
MHRLGDCNKTAKLAKFHRDLDYIEFLYDLCSIASPPSRSDTTAKDIAAAEDAKDAKGRGTP